MQDRTELQKTAEALTGEIDLIRTDLSEPGFPVAGAHRRLDSWLGRFVTFKHESDAYIARADKVIADCRAASERVEKLLQQARL